MKILVTGGGGFLGRFVSRALKKEGHDVVILGRGEYSFAKDEGFPTIREDICNREGITSALKSFDEVHHIAALTGLSVLREPFYRINVEGTRNVIDACIANGIGKLIYTSSPSVVYGSSHQEKVDESAPYPEKYISHYAETKAEAERMILAANQAGKLLTCSLRPHLIWGPEDTNLIPRLLDRASKNRLFIVGKGKNIVDMTYVENAARAHLLASRKLVEGSPVCGKAYFITNGEPVPLWNFINRILQGMGMPKLKKKMPLGLAYAIGGVMEGVYTLCGRKDEPIMTRFLALQLATSHCYSIENAGKDLGYSADISMDEGLERLFKYLKEGVGK